MRTRKRSRAGFTILEMMISTVVLAVLLDAVINGAIMIVRGATFGDKRSLYVAALRRYQQETLDELTEHLAKAPSPLGAIREFVEEVADHASGRDGRHGCFCINANIELSPSDDAIGDELRHHHDRMTAVLAATLARAKSAGELGKKTDCQGLATFVLSLVVAITVLGKQRATRQQIRAVVDHGLLPLRT